MSKLYSVPLVAQTCNKTCWHAYSLMLWFYWQRIISRQGLMNTMAGNYVNDKGVTIQQFVDLASKVGLKKVFHKYQNYTYIEQENFLYKFGPFPITF